MKQDGSARRALLWVPIIIAGVSLAASISVFGSTLVSAWIPFGLAALFGVASLPLASKWEWFTATSRRWVNGLCNFFVVGCVASIVILGGNYVFASERTAHREEVTVLKKYREKHYRTRRVNRRAVTSGAPYYTYHVQLEMADGSRKGVSMPYARYKNIRTGSVREVVIERGLWGMPVMRNELH